MTKFALLALLCCLLLPGCSRADVDLSKPLDLKFTALDGRQVDITKLRGKVVLIDFWATWCAPCRAISPDIVALYKKYHGKGLELIGVSVDSDKQAVLDFVKDEGAPWPQYFDGQGADNVVANKYGVEMFPTLWLVDKKGVVVDANFRELWESGDGNAAFTTEKLDAAIEKQLQAP